MLYPFFVSLLAALALVQCNPYQRIDDVEEQWHSFKEIHNKDYQSSDEEEYRKLVFRENLLTINQHNLLYDMGVETYKLGVNHFSDLTSEEFSALYTVPLMDFMVNSTRDTSYLLFDDSEEDSDVFDDDDYYDDTLLPTAVDWRSRGAVTPVKNQGQCGSCWTFSTTGAVEAQWYRKTRQLVSLSEQNLLDCSEGKYGNKGCNGGWMKSAMDYIRDNKGIDRENAYPYQGRQMSCRYRAGAKGATIRNAYVFRGEPQLQRVVANQGPVAVAVEVSGNFHRYQGGVYNYPQCGKKLNHAMLVVGYGSERGQNYWLVKNSWGTSWGDRGYIKMAMGRNNQCGIASAATFPII